MSSDDSGFDKEAEREKLREKYGDDEKDRENTRRMSELLLQGATMTGKHCDNCGDPIFRHDGQEFCPTCQHEARQQAQAQNAEARNQSAEAQNQSSEAQDRSSEARSQSGEAQGQPADAQDHPAEADEQVRETETARDAESEAPSEDDEPRVEINDVRVADQHADRSNVRRPPSQTDGRRESSADDSRRRVQVRRDQQGRSRRHGRDHTHADRHAHSDRHGHDASASTRNVGDAGDLGPAREALVRKLTDLARTAEETDDVARSRELLAATREAAEALAALDRANR